MDLGDQSPEEKGWLGRWLGRFLAWLLGDDADWVLGDLEERRRKRHGVSSGLARTRDLVSVAIWALGRRRTAHGGLGMDDWMRKLTHRITSANEALRVQHWWITRDENDHELRQRSQP